MKKIGIRLLAILIFGFINTAQGNMPGKGMPKVSSLKSLERHGKSKKMMTHPVPITQTGQEIPKVEQEIMIDLLIAAGCRTSGCARPLLPEYQEMIERMASMPQAEKWRLIGVLQRFDQIVLQKESNEESDKKLAKIRTEMYSPDSDDCKHHHAHASKRKHKRGGSF